MVLQTHIIRWYSVCWKTLAQRLQEPLVFAMAQARHWQEMLDNGTHGTTAELAKHLKVSATYVTRMLRLNYLAPDVVEAILDGREPSRLSVVKLTVPLPAAWEQQRERLGFAGEGRSQQRGTHSVIHTTRTQYG